VRRALAVVLAAGLAWQAAVCLWLVPAWEQRANVAPTPDGYPLLAENLVRNGTLGYEPVGASPTTVRAPGFPLWLATGRLAGLSSERWLALWGSLPLLIVGSITAGLLWTRRGPIACAVFAAAVLFHPLPSLVAGRAMSDGFHAALGWGAFLCWVAVPRLRHRSWGLAGTALLLAGHFLTRSSGLLTGVALLLVTAARERQRLRSLAIVLAVALLPAAAWSVRTSRLEGRPVYLHSLLGYNFWLGEAEDRLGAGTVPGTHIAQRRAFVLETAGMDGIAPREFWYGKLGPREVAEMERTLQRKAQQRIVRDPIGYAGRFLRGLVRFWIGADTRHRQTQYALAVIPLLLLAACGVWTNATSRSGRDGSLAWLALAAIVLHDAAYAAVLPYARFSVEIYPALGWLAAIGAARIVRAPRSLRGQNERTSPARTVRPGSGTRSFENGSSASRCRV